MSERRVWIAQCLCPSRHAILAAAGEADNEQAASEIRFSLQAAVERMLHSGEINPWCGLCHARADTWHYEVGRTRFRTMEEAKPALRENERQQAIARALLGEDGCDPPCAH